MGHGHGSGPGMGGTQLPSAFGPPGAMELTLGQGMWPIAQAHAPPFTPLLGTASGLGSGPHLEAGHGGAGGASSGQLVSAASFLLAASGAQVQEGEEAPLSTAPPGAAAPSAATASSAPVVQEVLVAAGEGAAAAHPSPHHRPPAMVAVSLGEVEPSPGPHHQIPPPGPQHQHPPKPGPAAAKAHTQRQILYSLLPHGLALRLVGLQGGLQGARTTLGPGLLQAPAGGMAAIVYLKPVVGDEEDFCMVISACLGLEIVRLVVTVPSCLSMCLVDPLPRICLWLQGVPSLFAWDAGVARQALGIMEKTGLALARLHGGWVQGMA